MMRLLRERDSQTFKTAPKGRRNRERIEDLLDQKEMAIREADLEKAKRNPEENKKRWKKNVTNFKKEKKTGAGEKIYA